MPTEEEEVQRYILYVSKIAPNASDLQAAGDFLVNRRITETLNGKDVDGTGFAQYSPAYALRKGTSAVTLYSPDRKGGSGEHMLEALEARVVDDGPTSSLEVGIFGNAELAARAKIQNEGGTLRTRLGTGHGGFKTPLGVGAKQKRGKALLEIPERRWLGASEEDLRDMQQVIVDRIDERVSKGDING